MTGHVRRRALVACLCLAAQSFALAHLFLVVHDRCSEHGEVVHGDDHHDHGDGLARWDIGGAERSTRSGDHDHCQTFAEPRDHRITPPVVSITLAATTALTLPSELAAPVTTRPLYRLAPKVSPPPHAHAI